MVEGMRTSFRSFGVGLLLALVLLYLILVAQFRSFVDPLIFLLAFPRGVIGVLVTLWSTGTTLNVMSLMGVVMLAGVSMSNSILIVEFAHHPSATAPEWRWPSRARAAFLLVYRGRAARGATPLTS
jgi:multidrug efflux pump subunit AcrB